MRVASDRSLRAASRSRIEAPTRLPTRRMARADRSVRNANGICHALNASAWARMLSIVSLRIFASELTSSAATAETSSDCTNKSATGSLTGLRLAMALNASCTCPQAMISIRSASDSNGEYCRMGAATTALRSRARRSTKSLGTHVRLLISSARMARTRTAASRARHSSVSMVSAKIWPLSRCDRPGIKRAILTASSARTSSFSSSARMRLVAAGDAGLAATAARVAGAAWVAR